MKNFTIIFRMTNSCNLNCTYCYDKNNHSNVKKENQIFLEKIPNIISNINKIWGKQNQKNEIIFHGGEPLIIDATSYDIFINEIKKNYPNTKFSMQTNGTLIDLEKIELIKKHKISLGISLDGFNEETNKYRIDISGRNSFNRVMKNIKLLKENKVNFGIIMTITKSSLGYEKELYEFISKNNLKCNIRPAFRCDNASLDYMTNENYFEFFKRLFEIWINDKEKRVKLTQIKEIYDEFAKAMQPAFNNKSCSCSENCFTNFISLDCEGNLYSCNRTYNNKAFFYGNILEINIEQLREITSNMGRERIKLLSNSKCKKCELFKECYGGCPANAYLEHKNFKDADDYFCEAKLKIREYVNQYLEKNMIKENYIEMMKNDKKLYK